MNDKLFNAIKSISIIEHTKEVIAQENKKIFDSYIESKINTDLLYFY